MSECCRLIRKTEEDGRRPHLSSLMLHSRAVQAALIMLWSGAVIASCWLMGYPTLRERDQWQHGCVVAGPCTSRGV
eukprot:5998504-Amphidinium_carterae.1